MFVYDCRECAIDFKVHGMLGVEYCYECKYRALSDAHARKIAKASKPKRVTIESLREVDPEAYRDHQRRKAKSRRDASIERYRAMEAANRERRKLKKVAEGYVSDPVGSCSACGSVIHLKQNKTGLCKKCWHKEYYREHKDSISAQGKVHRESKKKPKIIFRYYVVVHKKYLTSSFICVKMLSVEY